MSTFEIGEVVIMHSCPNLQKYNMTACKIIGHLEKRIGMVYGESQTMEGYLVRLDDGENYIIPPHMLKKLTKPNPWNRGNMDTKVRWESCDWNPLEGDVA